MVNLYDKFENLPEDKKKRIIEACVEEFSQKSFKDASTNSIVKKAGISKGILFHYFGSKKNLYLYVFDYILDKFVEMFNKKITNPPSDIFERIMNFGLIKLKIAYEHPLMYKFLLNAIQVPDDLQKEIQARYEKIYQASMPMLLSDIDTTKFRKEIDRNKAIEVIFFALEGISNKYLKIIKGMPPEEVFSKLESITEEYYEYIDILKCGVYSCEM